MMILANIAALRTLIKLGMLLAFAGIGVVGWSNPTTSVNFASLYRADAAAATPHAELARLPLSFIENLGQTDQTVRFHVEGAGHILFFTERGVVFSESRHEDSASRSVVNLVFHGALPHPAMRGLDRLPGAANFFNGNDPSQWRRNVPTFAGVAYRELYAGIDLVYRGTTGVLKSEFVVAPGADPSVIRMNYQGVTGLRLRSDGALMILTTGGTLVETPPFVFQWIEGQQVEVSGRYVLNKHQVGFELGAYNLDYPVVIDPTLVYSTYLGGSLRDEGRGIALDAAGHVYVAGTTSSLDFPQVPGRFLCIGDLVSKAEAEAPPNVQKNGCPFQKMSAGGSDVFVVKLDAEGKTLLYSTYIGGNHIELGSSLAIDDEGNAYVTGQTFSANFPTTPGAFDTSCGGDGLCNGLTDMFVFKLNADGSDLVYSTYLGGSLDQGFEAGVGIAVDGLGSAYVTGFTSSVDFPTRNAMFTYQGEDDAFVTKLNVDGSDLVYSTYLGGSRNDSGWGIAVHGDQAFVVGHTSSSDFFTVGSQPCIQRPTFPVNNTMVRALQLNTCPVQGQSAGGAEAFVVRLNSSGTGFVYSTYLGGSGFEMGFAIDTDAFGNAYVTGVTSSPDFPTTPGAFDSTCGPDGACGASQVFVSKLNPTGGQLIYSTYLGGSDATQHGRAIAVDASGQAFVAGFTLATDFPTKDALQFDQGEADAFVTMLNATGSSLIYSTYIGGAGVDNAWAIAVNDFGGVYVTGDTDSGDFLTSDALQLTLGGGKDAYVLKLVSNVVAPPGPIAPPGSPPPSNQSLAMALDTNRSGFLDDNEVKQGILYWIRDEVVPGTSETISDAKMRELITLWIVGTPVASNAQAESFSEMLTVNAIQLRVPSPLQRNITFIGRGVESVRVQVFDLAGRRLIQHSERGAQLRFELRDGLGQPLANGVYFYQVSAQGKDGDWWRSKIKMLVVFR